MIIAGPTAVFPVAGSLQSVPESALAADRMLACLDFPVDVQMSMERSSDAEVSITAAITSSLAADGVKVTLIAPREATLERGARSETVDIASGERLVRSWTLVMDADRDWTAYCEVRSAGGKLMGSGSTFSAGGGAVAEASSALATSPSATGAASTRLLAPEGYYLEVQWQYYDQLFSATKPCRGAYAELWLKDGPGSYQVVASTHADSSGKVNFTGIPAGAYQVVVFADNGLSGKVTNESGSTYRWVSGDIDVSSGVSMSFDIASDERGAWEAYSNMLDIWQWVHDQVAWDASPLTVRYPSLDWPQTDGMVIYMPNTGSAATSIWDRGTLFHEYAHCIMYQMRGGSFPPYEEGSHYVVSEMSEGFALIEGWAEFMQCAVDNDPYGLDVYMRGTRIIEDVVIADVLDAGDWDGNIIEGAVANVLWDLFDGVNASDAPSWDGSGIGDRVDGQLSTIWSVMLDNSPNSIDEVWEHWPQHDQYIWTVFCHARMNYDLVPPSNPTGLTASPEPGAWTGEKAIEVTLSGASDEGIGLAGFWYCWSQTPTDPTGANWSSASRLPAFEATDGVWYLCVRAQDRVGNLASGYYYEMWKIDAASPVTNISLSGTDASGGWYAPGVSITLSAADAGSEVESTWYRVDGGAWTAYSGLFVISAGGSHVIEAYSIDRVGNTETASGRTVLVDGIAPVTGSSIAGIPGSSGWYLSAVTVDLRPSDAGSGAEYTRYRIGDGPWAAYTGPISVTADGVHVVYFFSVDALGNTEGTVSLTVRIDATSPSTGLHKSGAEGGLGWYTSEVEASLAASDGGSGVAAIQYRLNGGAWCDYLAPLTLTEGTNILEYRSVDRAGNTEQARSEDILVDTKGPSIDLPADGTVLTTGSPRISWSSADEGSGVSQTFISIDGGAFVPFDPSSALSGLSDGEHELIVRAVDSAGNSVDQSTHFRVDTDPLSPTGPLGPWPSVALAAAVCAAAAALLVVLRRRRA
jgi:hypothetical protein